MSIHIRQEQNQYIVELKEEVWEISKNDVQNIIEDLDIDGAPITIVRKKLTHAVWDSEKKEVADRDVKFVWRLAIDYYKWRVSDSKLFTLLGKLKSYKNLYGRKEFWGSTKFHQRLSAQPA